MSLVAAASALLIGVTLGLLGGGGSILTVPVFVYALHIEPKLAIAMSLPVVGGAALVGAVRHARLGNVSLAVALPFGLATMAGAFAGARLASLLCVRGQFVLLGCVMFAAAVSMLRNAALPEPTPGRIARATPLVLVIGALVGLLTGIVGIGGGFLIVPALVLLAGVPMQQAVGTSLVVIAMNTAAGYAGYHGRVDIPWSLVLPFTAVTAIGILGGSALISRTPQSLLKRAFALLLFALGALLLWQNLT